MGSYLYKNRPLVSAIVSTYNSEKFIRGKIDDLLEQSIGNKLEIVIVNSGSLQNEDEIVKEYVAKHQNIKYIKTDQRETIYKAWNRGIKIAKGEFITNANTDDRLRIDAYEILSNLLIENKDVALVYADQYISNIENQKFDESINNKVIKFPDYDHIYQLERCIIGSQPMWRAYLHYSDNIWFNEKYEICGDHEFELRVSEKYKMFHVSTPLGVFYKSPLKTNKETQDPLRMIKEVNEVTNTFLLKYIETNSDEKLIESQKKLKKFTGLPLILYELLVRIERHLFSSVYPYWFKCSIEFVYYLNILIYLKFENKDKALKLCKKYLKYKKSDRIKNKYIELFKQE